MPIGAANVARFIQETERGTTPGSGQWTTLELIGDGLRPLVAKKLARVLANQTYPAARAVKPVGLDVGLLLASVPSAGNIKALVQMASERSPADDTLNSYTIQESRYGVDDVGYQGCLCERLTIRAVGGPNPSEPALVALEHRFACMGVDESASGVAAGAYPSGSLYPLHLAAATVNAVAADAVERLEYSIENELSLGPFDTNLRRAFIEDGYVRVRGSLTARFASNAWNQLVEGVDSASVVLVLDTGGSNESVTFTLSAAQFESAPLAGGPGQTIRQTLVFDSPGGLQVEFGSAL
jgi:hypothetical protein